MDIRKIIRIHKLISTETTGNPKELAERLEVSERSIYNYIAFIKTELNAPVEYDNLKKSYYYTQDCEFNLEGFIF
jgi:transcriptional antiterminator